MNDEQLSLPIEPGKTPSTADKILSDPAYAEAIALGEAHARQMIDHPEDSQLPLPTKVAVPSVGLVPKETVVTVKKAELGSRAKEGRKLMEQADVSVTPVELPHMPADYGNQGRSAAAQRVQRIADQTPRRRPRRRT